MLIYAIFYILYAYIILISIFLMIHNTAFKIKLIQFPYTLNLLKVLQN